MNFLPGNRNLPKAAIQLYHYAAVSLITYQKIAPVSKYKIRSLLFPADFQDFCDLIH